MQCPIDQTALVVTERSGIEIDYCPSCRGVWLDRGELDKLIDGEESAANQHQHNDEEGGEIFGEGLGHSNNSQRPQSESFLENLFDF
jgi:Zn-finger nucleic acid-binding protein